MELNKHNLAPISGDTTGLSGDESEDEFHLAEYWKLIKRHKWEVLGFAFVAMIVGALTAFSLPPVYRAEVKMLIEPEQKKIVSLDPLQSATNISYFYETQFEILRSKTVAVAVIMALGLENHEEFSEKKSEDATLPFGIKLDSLIPEQLAPMLESGGKEKNTLEKMVEKFQKKLTIKGEDKSQIVTIAFESNNRNLAASVANAVSKAYIDEGLEARLSTVKQAASWLTVRLEELRKQLADSEAALRAFQNKTGVVDSTSQQDIVRNRFSSITANLVQAERARVEAESRYNQVKTAKKLKKPYDSIKSVLADPLIQRLKEEESRLSRHVAELSERYGHKHPKMIAGKSDLKEAQTRLNVEIEKVVDGIRREYEVAANNEKELIRLSEKMKKDIRGLKGDEFKLASLEREVTANRELYNMFMTRFKETEVTGEDEGGTNVRIIDAAEPPSQPYKPRKVLMIAMFLIGGVFFGVLLSFVREHLDKTFKNGEDVERILKIPTIGSLPIIIDENTPDVRPEHYSHHNPKSLFAEAVNNIRTGVLFANIDNPPQTILVTSAVPGEGKTTLSVNLASSLSRLGRTLLIDADLRKPGIAEIFNVANKGETGLVGLVYGQKNLKESVLLFKKDAQNLYVLTSGMLPPNPLEFLSSQRFHNTLEKLKKRFKYIIVDTCPVLPYSDSITVAHMADEVIMVVRADHTSHDVSKDALKRLLSSNVTPLGIVLSQVDPHDEDGYGSYSYYYNQYAHEAKDIEIDNI